MIRKLSTRLCVVAAIAGATVAACQPGAAAAAEHRSSAANVATASEPAGTHGAPPADRSPRPTPAAQLATASLESVASKAGQTGRNIAVSLIGLALAIAAVVLAFRRDFKEAVAVFAVGIVCVLFASSAGETLLQDTVKALVGA